MIIDLVWYFNKAAEVYPLYRDGVRAAMEVLEDRGHTVRWHFGLEPEIPEDSDFIINWDNSTSEWIPEMNKLPQKKGLILTTDLGMDIESLRNYDVIFAEAQPVVDKIRPHGIYALKGFGTDTEFFCPDDTKKIWKAFYPATFSPWKRQNEFATIYKDKGLLLGTVQPDGWDILKKSLYLGTKVMLGYFDVKYIRDLYRASESVHITGWEGSGRTVLEALSMNIPVKVAMDNHKCQSYLLEARAHGLDSRKFVQECYSEEVYADIIMKGIENVS